MRNTIRLCTVALAVTLSALTLLPQARAANRFWTNIHGGSFTNVMNWSGGLVPGLADNANFHLPAAGSGRDSVQPTV